MRYKAALRDVSKVATQLASAKGGMLPFAERAMKADGKFLGVPRYSMTTVFFIRKDIMEAKGLKPPKVYDPDVVEFAKKTTDPAKDLWGFGQTLNRSDDGDGFMSNILWDYGGGVWDKDGKPALGTAFLKQNVVALQFAVDTIQKHRIQPPGVMGWTDVSNNEAYMAGKLVTTNNGASLYYAMVFVTWLLMGYFESIPEELEEAAMIDGATRFGAFARVVLPLAAPGLLAAGLYAFTQAWNEFLYALVFITNVKLRTLPVGLSSFITGDVYGWGFLMAGAVLTTLPVIAAYIYLQKYMVEGLTAGSVKG